jgi:hypothetical protein
MMTKNPPIRKYTRKIKNKDKTSPRIIARKQKYNNNSLMCVEGCIIILILLVLEQLNHSTI